jgi:hypothetical protein
MIVSTYVIFLISPFLAIWTCITGMALTLLAFMAAQNNEDIEKLKQQHETESVK